MKQPWTTLSALCYIQQLNKLCGGLLHDYRILKRSVTDHRPVNLNTIFLAFLIFWLRFGVELLCPARKREIVHVYPIFFQVVIMLKTSNTLTTTKTYKSSTTTKQKPELGSAVGMGLGLGGLGKITPFIWCVITGYWCSVSLLCFVFFLIRNSVTPTKWCLLPKKMHSNKNSNDFSNKKKKKEIKLRVKRIVQTENAWLE